jgi:hypothetical protein
MFGKEKSRRYKAVLVVPEGLVAIYKAQEFVGKVGEKTIDMSPYFEQWAMGMPE